MKHNSNKRKKRKKKKSEGTDKTVLVTLTPSWSGQASSLPPH